MIRGKLNITPFIAIEKIKNWCAYQERSHSDARQKLKGYGLDEEQIDSIIADLISENYLNEERFARAFTSGKLRIKHWGKTKIKMGLRQHKISDICINTALKSIDGDEYEIILKKVLEKKIKLTKGSDKRKIFYSVLNYAVSRGFETDLAKEQLNILLNENYTE